MAKPISSRTAILAVLAAMPGLVHSTPAPVGQEAQTAALDSIDQGMESLEGQARRSIFSGGSKPVSFSGEAIFRFIGSNYEKYPSWMTQDVTETKNSSASIRVGMVAAPHRNLRLWSKIGFNAALMGYNKPANSFVHDSSNVWQGTENTGTLDVRDIINYEDMSAGLIAKTGPVTTQAKIGGVLWTEASPLTLWKGQNRVFGWDYVPYELEQSNGQYYEYATLKGEKTGRAAWNKKPFQGINFESIEMPWNLYYSVTYGTFDQGQKYQPYMLNMNTANGLMASNEYPSGEQVPGPRVYGDKGIGLGDSYRKSLLIRLAKAELPGAVTMAVNYISHKTDDDYPRQFWNLWSGTGSNDQRPISAWFKRDSADSIGAYKANYFVNYQVASADFRRNLPGGLQFHLDVGFSNADTSFFRVVDTEFNSIATKGAKKVVWRRYGISDSATILNADKGEILGRRSTGWIPSVYGSIAYPLPIGGKTFDLQLQGIYAPKEFYSPGSFILPADVFFPYEANLVGVGKFAGADNGTPYVSNMTGANLTAKAPVANGHAKLNFGFHSQLEKGSDLIFLPWRLNGTAFNYSLNASSSRYDGATLTDAYMLGNTPAIDKISGWNMPARFRQIRRFGDEFFNGKNPTMNDADDISIYPLRRNPYAPQPGLAGGIRNDYLATFEAFGAYRLRSDSATRKKDLDEVKANWSTGAMPQTQKSTQNLSIDIAKDIARYWNGKSSVFMAFYGAMNSVTKSGSPIPTMSSGDDVLLSSYYLRFEPVVQITSKFYLVGLLGHETWKSDYGVASIDSVTGLNPDRKPKSGSVLEVSTNENIANPSNWHAAPIDYSDWSYGIGADIDLASRVGLHIRLQRFTHEDKGISKEVKAAAGKNDYQAWFLHAETKMWF